MDYDKAIEIVTNGTLEHVVEKVKETPTYEVFKKAVSKGNTSGETQEILAFSTLIDSFGDREMRLLLTTVANNMLFSALNTRLRSELGCTSD